MVFGFGKSLTNYWRKRGEFVGERGGSDLFFGGGR